LIWTEVTGLSEDIVSFSHHYCSAAVKRSGVTQASLLERAASSTIRRRAAWR